MRFVKKIIKAIIVFIWKVLRKLHIISDYTFRGLMLHFTDEYKFLSISPYFDKKWYVDTYEDVAINPTQHYMKFGFKEGKNPCDNFDGAGYLQALEGIRELTVNPLLDIDMCALRERRPSPSVVNFWGFFNSADGNTYMVLSSVLENIHFFINEEEYENTVGLTDSSVVFFDTYIKKEFSENAFYYNVSNIPPKMGMEFKVAIDLNIPLHILTLFVWSSFSYKYYLKEGQYLAVDRNIIKVTDYNGFYEHYMNICTDEQKMRLSQIAAIKDKEKDIILFSEFRNIANDNSWEIFKESVARGDNSYFVTGLSRYENEEDEEIKKHMLVYNSEEHIQAFMRCKKIICSWTLSDMVPTVFKHEFFAYPFIQSNWYYCPHGISYDKNSYFLTPIFLSQPKKLCCCSENEKNYFENKCGLKNVIVTGYPRMDKWDAPKNDAILFDFTYRKQYTDEYFDIIAEVVNKVMEAYPDRDIFYLFHPAISVKKQRLIKRKIRTYGKSEEELIAISKAQEEGTFVEPVQYAHSSEQTLFNKWFNECKYLITDYSSVAYDFAYKKSGISIYYMQEGFTENHYELYDEFYDNHCGIIVDNSDELVKTLNKELDTSVVEARKDKFFKYSDRENVKRVYKEFF